MGWYLIQQFGLAGVGAFLLWAAETQTAPENKNVVRGLAVLCFIGWIIVLVNMS